MTSTEGNAAFIKPLTSTQTADSHSGGGDWRTIYLHWMELYTASS